MKLKISQNEYVSSNCSLNLSNDLKDLKAHSYDWWQFLAVDSVGNVFFNDHSYSVSTSGHQVNVMSILIRLGIKVNLRIYRSCMSFGTYSNGGYIRNFEGIKGVLKHEIKQCQLVIKELIAEIRKKGSWKAKNETRKNQIKSIWFERKDLKRILNQYLDKKIIPIKSEKAFNSVHFSDYERYFKKPNGKTKINELNEFLKDRTNYVSAPESIDSIKTLFEMNSNHFDQLVTCLKYCFIDDLNEMIPVETSTEYGQLKRWLKRNDISLNNLTLLSLDKIHTYLLNKLNRKDYVPSEPKLFPLSEKALKLKNVPHLKLITNDRELKSEGKRQSHCIGSPSYIEACKAGSHALNYKGYTFFLSNDLEIKQTHGSYNSHTPEKIRNELIEIIKQA